MRAKCQNLFFALAYDASGDSADAGLLFAFFGILISPMLTAFAMTPPSFGRLACVTRVSDSQVGKYPNLAPRPARYFNLSMQRPIGRRSHRGPKPPVALAGAWRLALMGLDRYDALLVFPTTQ